ncbi:hypothetical protein [Erythrobacter sp. EC-HK427]|uniref:hypothetical protein n=1 Tax=Erythrobacter sp. EC-HK427 TaxID=2038396 RepID=UPI0012577E60|nr:hypothetical protein [Erythrobacter sp. EC-HK427]VVT03016.1 conserved hypothetical protein [Erythrobacter sp. EC-HK427]
MSKAIKGLIGLAEQSGGIGEFSQWSQSDVWWFDMSMPDGLRAVGNADACLRYFSSDATPHNPADEGFIDDAASLAIAFRRSQ